jgi:hypothetical protein
MEFQLIALGPLAVDLGRPSAAERAKRTLGSTRRISAAVGQIVL